MSESIKKSHLDNLLILLDAAKKIGCSVKLLKSGVIELVDGINALNDRIAELEDENEKLSTCIADLGTELDVEKRLSHQLYLLLVDDPKTKKNADKHIEALERELGRSMRDEL